MHTLYIDIQNRLFVLYIVFCTCTTMSQRLTTRIKVIENKHVCILYGSIDTEVVLL